MANITTRRRVSTRQLEILWDFLNSHRDIATAYNRSIQAKEYSARKWAEIAEILNAQGDGAYKDGKTWSKYWVDYKAKLKKRNAALHASRRRTGGGPSSEPPLSGLELKFLTILGEDFGQGLAGIRVDPFPETATTIGTGTTASQSVLAEVNFQNPIFLDLLDESEREEEPPQGNSAAEEPAGPSGAVEELAGPSGSAEEPAGPSGASEEPAGPSFGEAEEPAGPSPGPHRRRRRHALITREDARRRLIETAQERTEAAVRSSAAMQGVQESLAVLASGIMQIQKDLHDIKG